MKKLIFCLTTVLMLTVLVIGLTISTSAEVVGGNCGAEGDNVTWSFDTSTLTLTISGEGAMENYDYYYHHHYAPWYNSYQDLIVKVVIEDGVTSIGDEAFYYCDSLTSIEIPDSVTSIGGYAFLFCDSLTSVYVTDIAAWCAIDFSTSPSNPLRYANNLYLNGNLVTNLVIPDGVTSIGSSAFSGYDSLTSIEIPDSVTSIGSSAFFGCDSLTSIEILGSVTSIGSYAFSNCDSLTSIEILGSVTSIGDGAFDSCDSLTSVYITDLAAWCAIDFYDYDSNPLYYAEKLYLNGNLVTDLVIPDGVTSIGDDAFSNCGSLTSITIPDSTTGIGSSAFGNCFSLTSVYITDIAAWCAIDFYDYDSNPLYYAEKLYLNGNLVTDLVIPDGVTSIGDYAFYGCDSLTSIEIPDGVTSIGDDAFYNCYSLTSVVLPKGLTMVEPWFQYCYDLETVYIPANVIMIKGSAFAGTSLKTIIYCGTEAQWNAISKVTNWDGGKNPAVQYHDYDWESSGAEMHQGICIYCDSMIESIEHSFDEGEITTPATHTTAGVKTFTCTDCGETKTEEVAKIAEHTYGGWVTVTEATEDTEGLREKVCACGDRVTEVIPKLPKSEESTVEKSDGSITDTNEAPTVQEDDGMGVGAIVAISVGGTATAGIGGVAVWWFAIKKKKFSDLVKLVKKAPKAPPME